MVSVVVRVVTIDILPTVYKNNEQLCILYILPPIKATAMFFFNGKIEEILLFVFDTKQTQSNALFLRY